MHRIVDEIDDLDVLFSPCQIGPRAAPNRFVAQPMEACHGVDGAVSERSLERYVHLADGEWGIIIVETTSVTPTSLGTLGGPVLTESTLKSFELLVRKLKSRNPAGRPAAVGQTGRIARMSHQRPLSGFTRDLGARAR